MPSPYSYRHQFSWAIHFVIALVVVAIFSSLTPAAFAQTDVPDAPTDLAVYTYSSGKLEARWSTSDADSTDSFNIQWKSGSEEFDSSRQDTVDPATWKVALQSTSAREKVGYINGFMVIEEFQLDIYGCADSNLVFE